MHSSRSNASSPHGREVNNILNTLRGEQFRHSQNVRNSRSHVSSALGRNSPTLPAGLIGPDFEYNSPAVVARPGAEAEQGSSQKCSGPSPPKSWTLTSRSDIHDTPAWRAQALSIVFDNLSSSNSTSFVLPSVPPHERPLSTVPPLTLLCLRRLLSAFTTAEFIEDLIPYVSPHLRRELLRYTAIYSPLPNSKLYALFEPEGHADGDIIIVGPTASLRDDFFLRTTTAADDLDQPSHTEIKAVKSKSEFSSWDSDEWTPSPLHNFILLSTRLSVSTLLTLPPTITTLALINLPGPVPLHRLPTSCPLISTVDLSYNAWLSDAAADAATKTLERVDWSRWGQLRVLGFRECHVPDGMLGKLNKGRWDDVQVIQ